MTLVIALKWPISTGESILMVSDTRATTSVGIMYEAMAEPIHEDPGYAIIGSGMITGGILLLRLLGYRPNIDLGMLTAFILDMVSEFDPSVGPFVGESSLMRIEKRDNEKYVALGPLKAEALREYKEKISKRRELIRELWKLCDEIGEEEIEKKLKVALEKA